MLTAEPWTRETFNAANRRYRLRQSIASGPLPMFSDDGNKYPSVILERNIRIGNLLHLIDLRKETNEKK